MPTKPKKIRKNNISGWIILMGKLDSIYSCAFEKTLIKNEHFGVMIFDSKLEAQDYLKERKNEGVKEYNQALSDILQELNK